MVRPLVVSVLATSLVAACADAPSSPDQRLAPSPVAASRDVGAKASILGVLGGLSASVTVGGVAFADVDAMPGGWIERFNVYTGDQSTWITPPKFWRPTDLAAMTPITMPNVPSGTPNSLADWAIVKQTRDRANWYAMEPMAAWHEGMTCNPPPLVHPVASYDESPFLCRNHMMTAVNSSGYGVTYLTPNRLVDFSKAEAVVRFDVATLRSSSRDWIDLWITPYEDNLVVPLDDSLPDVQGYPNQGLHIRMSGDRSNTRFEGAFIYAHRAFRIPPTSTTTYEAAFAQFVPDSGFTHSLAPSATRRDTFELRLSGGRLRFGMPRYNLWWIDVPAIGLSLGSSGLGVVQLGHHSFAPSTGGGSPDTWHWDNVGMAPAVPFSIVNADRRYVDQASAPAAVTFTRPAPTGAKLRFAGYGSKFEIRANNGKWVAAALQDEQLDVDGRFHSYWVTVPAGTTRVEFRADNDPADKKVKTPIWMARDITIWSLNP